MGIVRKGWLLADQTTHLLQNFNSIVLLLARLYLAPIFLSAGFNKWHNFAATVSWFGDSEWGLGLPLPWLMAALATSAEIVGGLLLLVGLAVRLVTVPLLVTMIVAMVSVHGQHGWFAITPTNAATSPAALLAPLHIPGAAESLHNSEEAGKRLTAAKNLLREHGNYSWLTETGNFVILNNGIEFAATYFLLLLVLLCQGAGRYVSLDYWLVRKYRPS